MPDKPTYEELEFRIHELEEELSRSNRWGRDSEIQILKNPLPLNEGEDIEFEDLFSIEDIQRIQDEFALAAGVASIITRTDGTPITSPSNFCRLCRDIIRKTDQGLANCMKSDAQIGRFDPNGPIIQPCMSGGLWDAGAGITVGGRHIANWLIGQVRDESQNETNMRAYAQKIGADERLMLDALKEVPAISREKFEQIATLLFTIATQLSTTAYQNIQQKRFIQEIKRAEAKLRESEEKYRNIFNASSDSILIHDVKKGKILDVNDPMLSLYGYRREEVIGSYVDKISSGIAPYGQKNAEEKIAKARETGNHIFEWQARKKNGMFFWTEVNLRFSKLGEEEVVIAVVRDISERKQTQEIMIQTEKMMSVGGLAAGMAHEINNPLAGVLQNASVLSNRLEKKDIPANLKAAQDAGTSMDAIYQYMEARGIFGMLDAISKSGSRMASMVDNMLSFARKSEDSFSTHDPAALVDRVLELAATDYDLKKHYDFKSIIIQKEYRPNLPMLPCEGSKIQQVLLNILNNGAHAMLESRDLQAPRFIIRLVHESDANMLRMEIEDNGPGMDSETANRIFEPFFTTKPVGVGTGLGLSVSYFIITKNHNGRMNVITFPGKGANFIIHLPIKRKRDDINRV